MWHSCTVPMSAIFRRSSSNTTGLVRSSETSTNASNPELLRIEPRHIPSMYPASSKRRTRSKHGVGVKCTLGEIHIGDLGVALQRLQDAPVDHIEFRVAVYAGEKSLNCGVEKINPC